MPAVPERRLARRRGVRGSYSSVYVCVCGVRSAVCVVQSARAACGHWLGGARALRFFVFFRGVVSIFPKFRAMAILFFIDIVVLPKYIPIICHNSVCPHIIGRSATGILTINSCRIKRCGQFLGPGPDGENKTEQK